MADPNDSSLQFYRKATPAQWSYALKLYPEVLRVKAEQSRGTKKNGPEQLINLDNWYQNELPKLIKSRKEPHLLHEELVQVTKWRLMRGKFRPSLIDLVRINTMLVVTQTTKKAFKKATKDLAGAVTALTTLKGVSPASASAVLAAGFPEIAPYMADEAMISTPGVEANDYTVAEYMKFATEICAKCEKLKEADPETKWNPHKVELALWTHYIARDLKPELLEDMPGPQNNGNASKKAKIDDEDEEEEEEDIDDPVANDDSNDSASKGLPVAASTQANGNSAPDSGVLTDESSNSASASDILSYGDASNDNSQSRDAIAVANHSPPSSTTFSNNRLSSSASVIETKNNGNLNNTTTDTGNVTIVELKTNMNHVSNINNDNSNSISSSCASPVNSISATLEPITTTTTTTTTAIERLQHEAHLSVQPKHVINNSEDAVIVDLRVSNGRANEEEENDDDEAENGPVKKKLKISALASNDLSSSFPTSQPSSTTVSTTIPNLTNESSHSLLALNASAEGP